MLLALPVLVGFHLWDNGLEPEYQKQGLGKPQWRSCCFLLLISGFTQAAGMIFLNLSVTLTTVLLASLMNQTEIFFQVIAGVIIFKESCSGCSFISGFSLSVAGTVLVILGPTLLGTVYTYPYSVAVSYIGDAFGIGAAICFTIDLVVMKKVRAFIRSGPVTFWSVFLAACFSIIAYIPIRIFILTDDIFIPVTLRGWLILIGNAVFAQILCTVLYVYSVRDCPAVLFALAEVCSTVVSTVLAWIIYGESLNYIQIIGVVACVLGLVVVKLQPRDVLVFCRRIWCCDQKASETPYSSMK